MPSQAMQSSKSSSCNSSAYSEWRSSTLESSERLPLSYNDLRIDLLQVDRSDAKVWRTMNFDVEHDEFTSLYGGRRPERLNVTNGQAMEVSTVWCEDELRSIKTFSAGCHSPPVDYSSDEYAGDYPLHIHDAMCSKYCLASDYLRSEALTTSQCDCVELSTDKAALSYTRQGDFCLKNSGYLLCETIDFRTCDRCELRDFHCPRREYNTIEVPLRGYGDECNGGPTFLRHTSVFSVAYLAIVILLLR